MSEFRKRYAMATSAFTFGGRDISRNTPDLAWMESEDEENFYGRWLTGIGFINVKFPKDTVRPLTDEEVAHYNTKRVVGPGIDEIISIKDDER